MVNRGQALYLRLFSGATDYQRWQAYYVNQTVSLDSKTWSYHPFTADAFTGGSTPGERFTLQVPATNEAVETFTYALSLNWVCEVKLYEFNTLVSQTGPSASQVLIASVFGEVVEVRGGFTSLSVTLGSALAPVGAQAPPRTYTTALVGIPLRL